MEGRGSRYLIQDVFVEVWHVAMIRHRPVVIILEVLLQGHGVMWDVQHRVQVVGKNLNILHEHKGEKRSL